MRFKLLTAAILTFVMVISACATAAEETPTPSGTPLIPATGGIATETVAEPEHTATVLASETQASTETLAPAETPTLAGGPDVIVRVSNEGTVPYLVDHRGRSLYVYMNDTQNSSDSACMDDCAVDWPPLVILDIPVAGEGVEITQLGTIARADGSKQVTFNGWPLYYSNQDTIPGSTNGQSYNGVWFLISPDGEPIQQ